MKRNRTVNQFIFAILLVLVLLTNSLLISYAQQEVSPPLKQQWRKGLIEYSIKCQAGFELIGKKEDGSPACVIPSTFSKLILRGWGYDPLHEWNIEALDTYKVQQSINLIIKFQGVNFPIVEPPSVSISDFNGKTIWQSQPVVVLCCPFTEKDIHYFEQEWNIGILGMNKTGHYTISTEGINKNFTIIP